MPPLQLPTHPSHETYPMNHNSPTPLFGLLILLCSFLAISLFPNPEDTNFLPPILDASPERNNSPLSRIELPSSSTLPPVPYSEEWHAMLAAALIEVESGGRADAENRGEAAIGVLQIRPIMVKDVNRIAGTSYAHAAAWDPETSKRMLKTFVEHYCHDGTFEEAARSWNGGPKGPDRSSTLPYWAKVRAALEIKFPGCLDPSANQGASRGLHE